MSEGGGIVGDISQPTAEPKFKPGDLVLLKSGGPVMTVVSFRPVPPSACTRVETVWFNDRTVCQAVFAEPELLKVGE